MANGVVSTPNGAYEWQFAATHSDTIPASVLRRAKSITIAVVDSGADLTAPDLAAKSPSVVNILGRSADAGDTDGHGTFVGSLAAGSVVNGDGISGFGGDARLMIVKVGSGETFTDVDVARGILYAVDHGAKIINLSVAGRGASEAERKAVGYAVRHGALLVAAAGNDYLDGNPVEYPAAFIQPSAVPGKAGRGLVVAASDSAGNRAPFSSVGSFVSLAAPGANVFGAVSRASSPLVFPRVKLPGAAAGLYGFASGTSFAAPEVAGAAALVWAANPTLRANEVAAILQRTASGGGAWTPQLGYGLLNAAAAVAVASGLAG